jgi:UDP-2,3-diacylglucosamine pyrophosphatase LpxH
MEKHMKNTISVCTCVRATIFVSAPTFSRSRIVMKLLSCISISVFPISGNHDAMLEKLKKHDIWACYKCSCCLYPTFSRSKIAMKLLSCPNSVSVFHISGNHDTMVEKHHISAYIHVRNAIFVSTPTFWRSRILPYLYSPSIFSFPRYDTFPVFPSWYQG